MRFVFLMPAILCFAMDMLALSDTTAPTVSITAPATGSAISGTAVTVKASASDNVKVAGVQFLLDGANLGAEDTSSPYSATWNTTSSASGPHVLSARARDTSGNTALAANINVIVDNQAPTGTIVIDGGATVTNSTTAVLTLTATDALSTVTQMRFSNTGSSFSAAEAYAPTKSWKLASGAGTKTVYVQFKDSAGNWSGSLSGTIILDTTAPTISAVTPSNISSTSATITWTTNELATSQVEYGLTSSYGTLTPIDNALATSHSVVVPGLTPTTKYNYRVRSKDAAGNEKIGSNSTFKTLTAPDVTPPTVPANLSATAISSTQINLTWTASTDDVKVTRYLVFRDGSQVGTPTANSFSDIGLHPGTTYTYTVEAQDAAFNTSSPSTPASATTPYLTISNVSSSFITSSSATISWTTDAPADSQVAYGTTTDYGQLSTLDTTLVTSHSQTLTGLAESTLYHYQVRSNDANGNPSASLDSFFTTPSSSGFPPIGLDVHGHTDNNTTSAASVVVGPIGTPTAGDLIVCEFVFSSSASFVKVSDNVNRGAYLPAGSIHTDFTTDRRYGIYYKENAAALPTTIFLSYSKATAHGAMSCQAWKNVPPSFSLDSTFVQAQEGSAANPSTGTELIPFGDGRLIIGSLGTQTVTPVAGSNYTGIDSNPGSMLFPEYWVQTTQIATAAPYTAAADTWYDQMVAFAPNTSGYCDSSVIMDWTGGTDGATVSVADLTASTKGGRAQPLSDNGSASGWSLNGTSATGMTYSSSTYHPFARNLSCPVYAGSGTGTLGIEYGTTQAPHAALYFFDTTSPTVSAGVCFSTDLPNSDTGSSDVFTIYAATGTGAIDFDNVLLGGNGVTLALSVETGVGDSAASVPIVSGHNYWVGLQYVQNGPHVMRVYDGCGANPTLLGTITEAGKAGGSLADYLVVGSAGGLTATKGDNFFYGAVKLDYSYGNPLLP